MDHLRWGRYLLVLLVLIGLAACANKARLREQAGNHINIGSAYLGSAQYNSAIKELLEARQLTPEDPKVHYLLGIAYHGKGLEEKAIEEFQDYKNQFGNKPQALEADESIRQIRAEKAARDYDVAAFYEKQKKWKSAKVYYEGVAENYPETPSAARAKERLEVVIREESGQGGGFKLGLPKVGMPKLGMPKLGMPKLGMPKLPAVSMPSFPKMPLPHKSNNDSATPAKVSQ